MTSGHPAFSTTLTDVTGPRHPALPGTLAGQRGPEDGAQGDPLGGDGDYLRAAFAAAAGCLGGGDGASVSLVAQCYDVEANQLFDWMRDPCFRRTVRGRGGGATP